MTTVINRLIRSLLLAFFIVCLVVGLGCGMWLLAGLVHPANILYIGGGFYGDALMIIAGATLFTALVLGIFLLTSARDRKPLAVKASNHEAHGQGVTDPSSELQFHQRVMMISARLGQMEEKITDLETVLLSRATRTSACR